MADVFSRRRDSDATASDGDSTGCSKSSCNVPRRGLTLAVFAVWVWPPTFWPVRVWFSRFRREEFAPPMPMAFIPVPYIPVPVLPC